MEILKNLLLTIAAITLCVWLLVYFYQDHLLFFPPPPADPAHYARLPGVEAVELAKADSVKLRGYLVLPNAPPPYSLMIYFGGNAEEISPMVAQARHFPGFALLVINYRGYGASEGKPSERAFNSDALAIYDYAVARTGFNAQRVYAMGRSLGSGVAVALADQRPLAGVVLVTPYDSMVAIAHVHYRWLPASLLLKHRFDSLSRAPAIHAPLLMLTAGDDVVIPLARSDALFAAWAGAKSRLAIAGADHNSIDAYPAYWSAITGFLSGAAVPR
jgi:uncharacterized protein